MECPILYKHIPIVIGAHEFPKNLIQFEMLGFDIILGVDWLTTHRANIDCKNANVTLKNQKGREAYFCGQSNGKEYPIISIMGTCKLLRQGCIGYLCYRTEVREEEMKIENIFVRSV